MTLSKTINYEQIIEKEFIIEIGILETKLSDPSDFRPSRIIKTPADIFLNEQFLEDEYFVLFKPDTHDLSLNIQKFLHHLFFQEFLQNPEGADIFLLLSMFVPHHIISCIEDVLFKHFKIKYLTLIPSQLSALYTSSQENGILIDFSFSNVLFIPFYKGFVLQKFIRKSSKSGVTLFKKLHKSLKLLNARYEDKDFNSKVEILAQITTECVEFPNIDENNYCKQNLDKCKEAMQNKIIVNATPFGNVYFNYLGNYRVANHFFEDELNIAVDFLLFVLEMPSALHLLLIGNVIPTGGFVLLNNFLNRFKNELIELITHENEFKDKFSNQFLKSFYFGYSSYMSNLLHFGGALVLYRILKQNSKNKNIYNDKKNNLFSCI